MTVSPEKSPDLLQRPQFTKLRSPERSPILTRRSRSHERSPERARHLRQLKHRSLEIPSMLSRSPDISKRRSHFHEGSSESDERMLDQASTPIPIPSKPPTSHSPSSSETTPEKSPPQGDDTVIEGHFKTESEDSMGGSEAVTPKLEEPPTDQGRPDRSASVTGEIEQLPPLPEETVLSPDVISPSLKVANAEKQKGTTQDGTVTSKPLDDEQLLFDMLDNKEGSTDDVCYEPQTQNDQNINDRIREITRQEEDQHRVNRMEKPEGADDILAELDAELDEILDAEEEEEEEGEAEEPKEEKETSSVELEKIDTGGKEKKEQGGAKLGKTDTEGKEKELGGAKLDRTNTVDGEEKEEHQVVDKPICEESDVPSDSAIPKEIESESKPPVEFEGSPPDAEPPSDLEPIPPETTIEITDTNKQDLSTEVESVTPSQIQEEHVERPPEAKPQQDEAAEPPTVAGIKVVPAPLSDELEIQVEPVPTNTDSEQPDVGQESQKPNPESSEAESKPPKVQPGQLEVEDESQAIESEPPETVSEPSESEPQPLDVEIRPSEDKLEPQEHEHEQLEVAVKVEPSEPQEETVNTGAEPSSSGQELEVTISHEEQPERKSEDREALNRASVNEQDGNIDNDGRTLEDSPAKSEGQSDQLPAKSEGESDQSPTKSEGESDQSPTKSEGESDQVVTEDDKIKGELSLKKEDSIQESEER